MIKALLLLSLLSSMIALAGQDVGKGGDAVRCGSELLALDYLVFSAAQNAAAISVTSYEQSLFRIRKNLANKLPELVPSFDEYTAQIFNTDQNQKHIWEAAPFQLTPIDDQNLPLAVKLPESCHVDGKISLVQAVIRQNPQFSGTPHIIFKYMPDVVNEMNAKNPLQLSFLLVHEWLWSHSDNVDRNRRINWLFHSSDLDQMNREQLLKTLIALGFDPTSVPVVVDAKGFGTYRNLQEALLNYQEGQTLLLKEGVYNTGGVAILRPVTLIGDGDRNKIIIQGSTSYPAVSIESSGVVVRNLTLKRPNSGLSPDKREGVLEAHSAQVLVENCQFVDSHVRTLVRLDGDSTGTFRQNDFLSTEDITIFSLFDQSNMNLRENYFNRGRLLWNWTFSKTASIVEKNKFGEKFECAIDTNGPEGATSDQGQILLKDNVFEAPTCRKNLIFNSVAPL